MVLGSARSRLDTLFRRYAGSGVQDQAGSGSSLASVYQAAQPAGSHQGRFVAGKRVSRHAGCDGVTRSVNLKTERLVRTFRRKGILAVFKHLVDFNLVQIVSEPGDADENGFRQISRLSSA